MIQGNSETQRHIFQEQYHLYIQKLYYINGQDCLFSCISKILDANIVTNHAPVKHNIIIDESIKANSKMFAAMDI